MLTHSLTFIIDYVIPVKTGIQSKMDALDTDPVSGTGHACVGMVTNQSTQTIPAKAGIQCLTM